MTLANRVVLPAMDMNLCDDGDFSAAEIAHYTARAAGGVGLIITGTGAVAWPIGACSWHQPSFSDDRHIPSIKALADSVHAAGSKLCVQICHHGKTAGVDTAQGRPLLVPSLPEGKLDLAALQDNTIDELMKLGSASRGKQAIHKEADEDDLAWVIDQFAQGANRASRAGVDAIEIHAAHGYLVNTFLSSGYNKRTDRWGGSVENRGRLMTDIIRAVRAQVGHTIAISVRLNGMEYGLQDGMTPSEAAIFALMAQDAGADAIHVSANAHNPFGDFTDGPLPSGEAQYREFARIVKKSVTIPVIAVGRISPEIGDEMITRGECDFVSMGRQLLADADLVNKLKAGQRKSIRPCINCYVCVEQNFFDAPPKCAVNPALCNEPLAQLIPAPRAKRVLVVGGGPAGLEAARIAAMRGHLVSLYEASSRLGGTAWFSQLTTPANGPLVEWLEHEVRRLGVQIFLKTRLLAADILELVPDEVVVATGAVRNRPANEHTDYAESRVYTGDDLRALLTGEGIVLSASIKTRLIAQLARLFGISRSITRVRTWSKMYLPLSKDITVVGGGLVGLELAEFLATRGRTVTVVEEQAQLGLPMAMPRRWTAVQNATRHGVQLRRSSTDVIASKDVIIANNVVAAAPIADELRTAGMLVHVIGDAHDIGYIEGAIHSAGIVAREI
ncbi:MAG: oxidoreductase [Ilumatobacteraceae bacterium]|nr:oxidoreductase [Ilumatobacteraceae bacterium]